jgi:cobalt-zinc-cadmium efflux system membrane fusion protein
VAVITRWCSSIVIALLAVGCSREAPPAAESEELEALSVTTWTPRTELFAEYPPLVLGQPSRFAIHLTRLTDFKALLEGEVEVLLRGGAGASESFRVDKPSRPGIFGVTVTPARPGTRELVIRLRAAGLHDEHVVGEVVVHPNAEAARRAADAGGDDAAPGISFLKEQQWTLDFGTALVAEQALAVSLRAPGRVVSRAGGEAAVLAPIDGRLSTVAALPVGTSVKRGQELARVTPAIASPGDLPQLLQARDEATSALALATRDRERAERLIAAGAAPEKRLDEARTAEAMARTRVTAADASLTQFDVARQGGAGGGTFVVRAPIDGVISSRTAATGETATTGRELFRVVDAAQVHVVAHVAEADASRAARPTGAEMEVPGHDARLRLGPLVTVGRVIDPQTRTLPVTFAFDNRAAAVPVGQAAVLYLATGETPARPVVPAAAVVDDAGRPIVFVQRGGETFERRAVTLGARQGDVVQVVEGVKTGERIVTRGAHLVRLASLSTSVPAHGHVH